MHVTHRYPVAHAVHVRDVVHAALMIAAVCWLGGCMPSFIAKKERSGFVPQAVQGASGVECYLPDDDMIC